MSVRPEHASRYPIGAGVSEEELLRDPYPVYARLHAREPVSWISGLGMWWVVGYDQVCEILQDACTFVTESERSTIFDTFGPQMLSVEGAEHDRYKNGVRAAFQPRAIREKLESEIARQADLLIDRFAGGRRIELAAAFARELPIRTMLSVFGLPQSDMSMLRQWYDAFERALANFRWDAKIRADAGFAVAAFHDHLQRAIELARNRPSDSLLDMLVGTIGSAGLRDDEIRRNALIILFGGISTVEALILNTVWTLSVCDGARARLLADPATLPRVIEEVVRWQSPVQSATRHVVRDIAIHGHPFRRGDVVNCMLGAANRDPRMFADADRFDPDRPAFPKHLGFAVGPHVCLGLHLARSEALIALRCLYGRLGGMRMDAGAASAPEGYEFRKPPFLNVVWH